MQTLKVRNLVKTFPIKRGRITAVDKVSFDVKKGEIFGLLGVNGAGKSTTINIVSGLMSPDSGKVSIFGKDFFSNQEEIKKRFNIATAYYNLNHRLTVRQNLRVYTKLYNISKPEKKIARLAEEFMMSRHLNAKIVSLSSGEKTRVVLVKALLNDPELLFLDECTVGLDPDMAEVTRDLLRRYNKEQGCSILFTSHYMQEVERLCDRIAFMNEGKIIKIGSAHDLVKELDQQKVRLHFSRNKERAKKVLRKAGIEVEEPGRGVLIFNIKNRKKVLYPILEKLVNAQAAFDNIHLEKPTLEEYFIQQSRKKR